MSRDSEFQGGVLGARALCENVQTSLGRKLTVEPPFAGAMLLPPRPRPPYSAKPDTQDTGSIFSGKGIECAFHSDKTEPMRPARGWIGNKALTPHPGGPRPAQPPLQPSKMHFS